MGSSRRTTQDIADDLKPLAENIVGDVQRGNDVNAVGSCREDHHTTLTALGDHVLLASKIINEFHRPEATNPPNVTDDGAPLRSFLQRRSDDLVAEPGGVVDRVSSSIAVIAATAAAVARG